MFSPSRSHLTLAATSMRGVRTLQPSFYELARILWKARHSSGHVDSSGIFNPTAQSQIVCALSAERPNFVLLMTTRRALGVMNSRCTGSAQVGLDVE